MTNLDFETTFLNHVNNNLRKWTLKIILWKWRLN